MLFFSLVSFLCSTVAVMIMINAQWLLIVFFVACGAYYVHCIL